MIEDVNGFIVGPSYIEGQVYYQNRPQGPKLYALDEVELRGHAESAIEQMKAECGDALMYIYPDNSAWTLRIYS